MRDAVAQGVMVYADIECKLADQVQAAEKAEAAVGQPDHEGSVGLEVAVGVVTASTVERRETEATTAVTTVAPQREEAVSAVRGLPVEHQQPITAVAFKWAIS